MPSPVHTNEEELKMRPDVLLADLKTVREAAEILGVSERRVRAFINPICNCVARRRAQRTKAEGEGKLHSVFDGADPNCLRCKGSGKTPARLRAVQKGKQYFILHNDLLEFASKPRVLGAPKKN